MSSPPIILPPSFPSSSSSSPPYSSYSYNTSLLVVATLLAFTFAFTIIVQLILRLLAHLSSDSDPSFSISNINSTIDDMHSHVDSDCKSIIDFLPVFTVSSLPRSASANCTICLSQFASDDKLRLLPVCRHSFHASCIDAWLKSSPTCPLCRSLVQILSPEPTPEQQPPPPPPPPPQPPQEQQQDIPASEDTSRISWLKDYIDRLGFSSPSPINSMRFSTSPFSSMRFSMWGSRRSDGEGPGRSLELGGGEEHPSPDSNSSTDHFAAAFKWLMGGAA